MASRESLIDVIEDIVIGGDYYEKYLEYYWDSPRKLERDIEKLRRVLAEVRRSPIFRSRELGLGAGALGSIVSDIFSAALEVSERLLGVAEEDLERLIRTGSLEM